MKKKKIIPRISEKLIENKIYIFVCIMTIIVVSLPAISGGIFWGHDSGFHFQRIISIKNSLLRGEFPVRIFKEIWGGYGYGAPLCYPSIFLYVPAILYLIGCPLIVSYNLFLICINILTLFIAIYSYTIITNSKEVGLLSAILYELSIYRMVDLYTRSAVGEYLALTFCPLILCGLVLIYRGYFQKWWVLALGFSGIIQSHILSFVLMSIVTSIYIIFHLKSFLQRERILAMVKAAIATLLINIWFLIPLLQIYGHDFRISTLGSGFWDTDTQIFYLFDFLLIGISGMPRTPSLLLIIGCILLTYQILISNDHRELLQNVKGYLMAGIISTFMLTNLFPWFLFKIKYLQGFLEKFQFIWRLNTVCILTLSICAAYGFYYYLISTRTKYHVIFSITLITCIYSLMYINRYVDTAEKVGSDVVLDRLWMDDLYLPKNNTIFSREELKSNIENIQYYDYKRGDSKVSLQYSIPEQQSSAYIDVPITYYPGYIAYINESQADVVCSEEGVVRVLLPQNLVDGTLSVQYEECLLYKIADMISLISIITFLIFIIRQFQKN